jgi:hypothetical protein
MNRRAGHRVGEKAVTRAFVKHTGTRSDAETGHDVAGLTAEFGDTNVRAFHDRAVIEVPAELVGVRDGFAPEIGEPGIPAGEGGFQVAGSSGRLPCMTDRKAHRRSRMARAVTAGTA